MCVCAHQQIIVSYPPTKQLSSEEQDLVWKFRYYLTTQEKVGVLVTHDYSGFYLNLQRLKLRIFTASSSSSSSSSHHRP